jgi:hypothetical protein
LIHGKERGFQLLLGRGRPALKVHGLSGSPPIQYCARVRHVLLLIPEISPNAANSGQGQLILQLLIVAIKFYHDHPPLHNYANMNFRTMPEASGAAGFMPYNCLYRTRGNAVARLTARQRPSEMQLNSRNIGTKRRNQKFVLALGDVFADMAVILTVGVHGMSLL